MKKYSMETVVGIFVVIGLLCVAYMTVKLGKVSLFGDDYYSLYARFGSVSGLREGSPIEIDGIEVGRVERLTLDQEKQLALITLKIRKGVKVYDDAIRIDQDCRSHRRQVRQDRSRREVVISSSRKERLPKPPLLPI